MLFNFANIKNIDLVMVPAKPRVTLFCSIVLYRWVWCLLQQTLAFQLCVKPRQGISRLERLPRKRRVGCSNPGRDRPNYISCKTLGNGCKCHRSSEMTIINGCSVSQQVWYAKEPSLPQMPSIGQNLQPFTGKNDVSI